MEIGNKKYIFVLNKVKINSNGHVVFKVSTKEIKLSEKKMLKLPHGHHDRVRFDIDTTVYCYGDGISPSASFEYASCIDKAAGNNNMLTCYNTCLSKNPVSSSNIGTSNYGATPNPITNNYIICTLNCLNNGVPN
jgi:hypothetical protein